VGGFAESARDLADGSELQPVRSGPALVPPRDPGGGTLAPDVAWPRGGGHGSPDGRGFCSGAEALPRLSAVELAEASAADLSEGPAGLLTPAVVLAVLPGTGMAVVCADAVGCDGADRGGGNSDAPFSSEIFHRNFKLKTELFEQTFS